MVYFRKTRDKHWNGPARVVQKESKSLQCVIRQKTLTIKDDGTLISKPDTFSAIEEENPITSNQQTENIQEQLEKEEKAIRDQLQAVEKELALARVKLAKKEEIFKSQKRLIAKLQVEYESKLDRRNERSSQPG